MCLNCVLNNIWIIFLFDTQFSSRLVPKLFYNCDQGQADPVVAVARDQSSVYLKLLMHETQPPSHFAVSTITRCVTCLALLQKEWRPKFHFAVSRTVVKSCKPKCLWIPLLVCRSTCRRFKFYRNWLMFKDYFVSYWWCAHTESLFWDSFFSQTWSHPTCPLNYKTRSSSSS